MKKRLRNVTTLEVRDAEIGSDEDHELSSEVYSVKGVSKRLWILEHEWRAIEDAKAALTIESDEVVHFGSHSRRLTPGEVEMGILSYDQKEAELLGDQPLDETPEEDETILTPEEIEAQRIAAEVEDDEEDDEVEQEPVSSPSKVGGARSAPKQSRPRKRVTRASGARKAA